MAIESLSVPWQDWHVKVAVLSSLLLQWLLLLLATFRKRTANTFLRYFIYGIYLLSTKVAFAAFYLIVGARFFVINKMPFGLWAAVMALHLAGQERLTAFSLEDNNLWRSSTLKIILQILVHLGLFFPLVDLPFPTRIMLFLAVWRIACRGYRLRMGTKEMMVSWEFPPQMPVNIDDDDDSQVVRNANLLLKSSSLNLLAEVECTSTYMDQVRRIFTAIKKPEHAIRIAEIELNFIYESFHTDGTIRKHLNDNWSLVYAFLRSIESIFCVAALAFYIISSSTHLRSTDISQADNNVTNLLLWGTVTLELFSYIMTVFSDWTIAALKGSHYGPTIGRYIFYLVPQRRRWWTAADYETYMSAPVWVKFARNLFRRWSETICKFNFLRYSIQTSSLGQRSKSYARQLDELIGTQNLITSFKFVSEEWYNDHLGKYIFEQLQTSETNTITSLKTDNWPTDDSYRIDVVVWHIATELLFITSDKSQRYMHCEKSKLLSDYMAYLLFMKPHFLPKSWKNPLEKSEAAQEYIHKIAELHQDQACFQDRLRRCCQDILNLNITTAQSQADDYVRSLSRAIARFNEFHGTYGDNREALWGKLSEEWVKILVFAASKYDKFEHIQGLGQGGELISIVWLLAFHLNIITINMNIQDDTIV